MSSRCAPIFRSISCCSASPRARSISGKACSRRNWWRWLCFWLFHFFSRPPSAPNISMARPIGCTAASPMPSSRWRRWSACRRSITSFVSKKKCLRAHLGDQRVGHFEIRINVLHVVVLVERVDEFQNLLALLVVDRNRILRPPHQGGFARLAEFGFERLDQPAEILRPGVHLVAAY